MANKMQLGLTKFFSEKMSLSVSVVRGVPRIYVNPLEADNRPGKYIFKAILYQSLIRRINKGLDDLMARSITKVSLAAEQMYIQVPEGTDPAEVPNKRWYLTLGFDADKAYIEIAFIALDGTKCIERFSLNTTTEVSTIGHPKDDWTESKAYDGLWAFRSFMVEQLPLSIAATRDMMDIEHQLTTTPPKKDEEDIPFI